MIRVFAILLIVLLTSTCSSHAHKPLEQGTYIILLDMPNEPNSASLYTGSKTYHNRGRQWDLSISLLNDVRAIVDKYDLRVVELWPLDNIKELCLVVTIDPNELEVLAADQRISAIQEVNYFDVMGTQYDDPSYTLQMGANATQFEKMHDWSMGEHIKVGIIDTPVDLDHEDLKGQLISQEIFVRDNLDAEDKLHGTAIAGIIAANSNNGIGIVGYAPAVSMRSYAACYYRDGWQRSVCDTFALAKALATAQEDGLDVLNLSLSGPDDPLLSRLIESVVKAGTIVVAADNPSNPLRRFPASMESVLAVTSPDNMSSYEPPAIGIKDEHLSTKPGNLYQFFYGTSMATARVTALTALILSKKSLTTDEVRSMLMTLDQICQDKDMQNGVCTMIFAIETNAKGMNAGL